MKWPLQAIVFLLLLIPWTACAEPDVVWQIITEDGRVLTEICYEPSVNDIYISAENMRYEILSVEGQQAVAANCGAVALPSVDWMYQEAALPVAFMKKKISLYCTHSDESYQPSDGYYTTNQRGTIYQVAQALASSLEESGIEAAVSDALHHPHDAGAYRRSRQTAVELLKTTMPDCLLDIHRDGIPDPASYEVDIGGEEASKIRLLVGRGNQNAEVNKAFALTIKAVADRVYPGLIKDIYMGKGTFNQDLLPKSILLECGTYTLKKERVLTSMPMMADVLNRALYGEVIGSAGQMATDVQSGRSTKGGITAGEPDANPDHYESGTGAGFGFLGVLLLIAVLGFAILSTGSIKGGARKAARNISEMTGGLAGKRPDDDEKHEHS